jgi:hypothetical protein
MLDKFITVCIAIAIGGAALYIAQSAKKVLSVYKLEFSVPRPSG